MSKGKMGGEKFMDTQQLLPQAIATPIYEMQKIVSGDSAALNKARKWAARLVTQYLWVGIILLILGIIWYYNRQVNKGVNNNERMKSEYLSLAPSIGIITDTDANFKLNEKDGIGRLRDYYVASSYNSCCAGDFQDDFVSTSPLREVIQQGVRVLDFALYQVGGDVVVGAGPTDSDNIKGTYNSVPVGGYDGVFSTINKFAFSAPCPNPTDPLILHFRVKSKTSPQTFYRKLTDYVKDAFSSKLLPPEYGYEGRPEAPGGGKNLATEPILNLRNKIIIMCDQKSNNFRGTAFEEFVNMSSGSPYLQEVRNYDVQYTHEPDGFKDFNKKNITVSMPDISALNDNVPAQLHMSYGCQMVCMNYANLDSNMKYYHDFFNDAGYAFVLKPKALRYIQVTLPPPKKQDPALDMTARNTNIGGMYALTL